MSWRLAIPLAAVATVCAATAAPGQEAKPTCSKCGQTYPSGTKFCTPTVTVAVSSPPLPSLMV